MRNKTEDKPELTKAQNAASGATAGVIARLVIAPLDVVKIRFQIQTSVRSQHNQPKYRGIIQSMTTIAKEEGIRGLWKGNWPAEYLYLTYGAVQFLAYHESLKLYPETMPLSGKVFVAGAIAGTTATVVTYPLDLLRTRFAMQGTHKVYSGIVNACLQIAKTEGVRGFYRGVWTSLLQIAPYMGIMFGIQDILVEKLKRIEPGYWPHGWDQFASGAAAGIISKTAVMPFDVVRKRLQVQGPSRDSYVISNIPQYSGFGFTKCAREIVRTEGILALYKGLLPSLVKTAPSSAVTFWVVNECRHLFSEYNERTEKRYQTVPEQ